MKPSELLQYHKLLTDEEYLIRVSNLPIPNSKSVIEKIKQMKKKCSKKVNPHSYELSRLMNATFSCRYMEIFKNRLSVHNTIVHYPGLRFYDQVKLEFEKVTGKTLVLFDDFLTKRVCIKNRTRNVAVSDPNYLCESAVAYLIDLEADPRCSLPFWTSSVKLAAEMIIFVSDHFMGDWLNEFVMIETTGQELTMNPSAIPRAHPFILITGDILDEDCASVYCERTKIMSNLTFWNAVLLCYYLHYIFNLTYLESDAGLFQAFDAELASNQKFV
ncbi:unnamed protein product [Orchesella dallaii]|uniref:Uncharacterized protein n=1 Tax=Orchesella dallaii TaxID=48710 RepID=A0ABP1R4X2_9HEXA